MTRIEMATRAAAVIVLGVAPASAQVLGTFRWQVAPYCNVVTLRVEQKQTVFELSGTDDQCGNGAAAATNGSAHLNPNGMVGMGFTVIRPDGIPIITSALIAPSTLSGTWSDEYGSSGVFTFNPSAVTGQPRGIPVQTPYEASVEQFCFAANRACDFTFAPVPAGKRLILEHASGYFGSDQNAQYVFVSLRKGTRNVQFLPTNYQGCGGDISCPSSLYVFNQAVQVTYEGGTAPIVRITKGAPGYPIMSGANAALPFQNTVVVSGYLVDCTNSATCQAVVP